MPVFEYACKECGNFFEKLQLAGREQGVKCPVCTSQDVERKISRPFLPSSVGKPANEERVSRCENKQTNSGCQAGG